MLKIDLEDGKYNIYIDETTNIIQKIDRYNNEWINNKELWSIRLLNCWHALLWAYLNLKEENEKLKKELTNV